jgi:predicted SprT family Zn-dependent metalloprotease
MSPIAAAVPRSELRSAPRGCEPAPDLTDELRALYRRLTGAECLADVYLSPRMGTRTAGQYRSTPNGHQIVLSRRYLRLASRQQAEDLMLHELAHYHLAVTGHPYAGHGALFRALMRAWSFPRFPDREILRTIAGQTPRVRHLYLCPAGHEHWLSRHPRRRAVSCALCSPRYDRRYRLRYSGVSERRGPIQETFDQGV